MRALWVFVAVLGAPILHAPVSPGYDQGDFVLVVWALLLPIWVMTPVQALIVFGLVSALHLAINVIAYAVGARDTPL